MILKIFFNGWEYFKDKLMSKQYKSQMKKCGTNVTILKGVTIGRGSVIAVGGVVNKSTPPYSISGGVPAKNIGFPLYN